jgi:L-rhamnose mutarotase
MFCGYCYLWQTLTKGGRVVTNRYCFALDLKDEPALIEEYKKYHAPGEVWPEIIESIKQVGIENMEIFLVGNRLFMLMQVSDGFNPQAKAAADALNPKVQEWESLMATFQQSLPWAKPDQKWMPMEQIFSLKD